MRSRLPAKRRKWLSRGSTLPGASEENSKFRTTLISDQHSCFRQLGSLLRQGVNSGALPLACGSKLGLLLCKIAKTQPGTSFLAGSRLNVAGRGAFTRHASELLPSKRDEGCSCGKKNCVAGVSWWEHACAGISCADRRSNKRRRGEPTGQAVA